MHICKLANENEVSDFQMPRGLQPVQWLRRNSWAEKELGRYFPSEASQSRL